MAAFPLDTLRAAFPSLANADDGRRRIYLDNPAGTQVPAVVADAVREAILNRNANLGGDFPTSIAAGKIIDDGHAAMAEFLNCDFEEVVIGSNMTSLTYHFSRMIGKTLERGDEIIVTQMDHEGNVSPWLQLAEEMGLQVRKLPFSTESWQVEPESLRSMIGDRTRLLALNYSSNLTGSINDAAALMEIARSKGVMTYVDAVQFAPHGLVDVRALDCDFLVCSSYKFFGPHLGILYGRRSVLDQLDAYKCRCSDNTLPFRFETGTPQIELVAGLTAAVGHFVWLGELCGETGSSRDRIAAAYRASIAHENFLCGELISGLGEVGGLTIHGITDHRQFDRRVPTVSFTLEDITPQELVARLNEEGIFCWAGHNYAWEVVHQLGINPDHGVVRIGIASYNTTEEIAETVESIQRNIRMLRQG